MFDWLADLLGAIICLLQNIVGAIVAGAILAINAVVAALAALAGVVLGLLPDMPADPDLPAAFDTAMGWVQWVFPVAAALAFVGFAIAAWLIWQGVAVVLRWAKAID